MVINIDNEKFYIWLKNYKLISDILSECVDDNTYVTLYGTGKDNLLYKTKENNSLKEVQFNTEELSDMLFDLQFDVLNCLMDNIDFEKENKIGW